MKYFTHIFAAMTFAEERIQKENTRGMREKVNKCVFVIKTDLLQKVMFEFTHTLTYFSWSFVNIIASTKNIIVVSRLPRWVTIL